MTENMTNIYWEQMKSLLFHDIVNRIESESKELSFSSKQHYINLWLSDFMIYNDGFKNGPYINDNESWKDNRVLKE